MDTRIYVMTHKECDKPGSDMYKILHVGRAIGEDLGYQGDDTGDNISSKNRNYSELTGLYWLWKNVKCDNVGVCHYRRYFVDEQHYIHTQAQIESMLEKYDIIVPRGNFAGCIDDEKSVRIHYADNHYEKDLMLCGEVIEEICPDYSDAYNLSINSCLFSPCNMMITRKAIFDEYCEWLFAILSEVEKRIDISEYHEYQSRVLGFLSERLLNVWFLNNRYLVRCLKVYLTESMDIIDRTWLGS